MEKTNYLIKKNNTQKVYLTEDTLEITLILNEDYPYIMDSIRKENFILKSEKCNLFKELVFDNKVVGFSTNQAVRSEKINYARETIRMLQDVKATYESELNLLMQGDYVKGSIINDGRVKELNLLIMGVDKQLHKITPKYKQLVTGSSPLTETFNKVRDSIKNKSAKPAAKPDSNEKPKDPAINQEDGPQPGEA